METSTLIIVAVAILTINLTVFYFLIKFAVQAANEKLLANVEMLLQLKTIEMNKEGYGEDVQKVFYKHQEVERLRTQKSNGYINAQQFEQKVRELDTL